MQQQTLRFFKEITTPYVVVVFGVVNLDSLRPFLADIRGNSV